MIRSDDRAAPTVVLEGVVLGESPRWHDGRLWFCDWGRREVVAVDESGGTERLAATPAHPWSIAWQDDGSLLFTVAGEAALIRRDTGGALATVADLGALSTGWNEIVTDGRGNTFVNAVGFDLMAGEAPRPGLVAVVTRDGSARAVAGDMQFPNGMVVT